MQHDRCIAIICEHLLIRYVISFISTLHTHVEYTHASRTSWNMYHLAGVDSETPKFILLGRLPNRPIGSWSQSESFAICLGWMIFTSIDDKGILNLNESKIMCKYIYIFVCMYTVHVYVYGYTYCLGFMHSSSSYIFIAITAIETLHFLLKAETPRRGEKGSPRALG